MGNEKRGSHRVWRGAAILTGAALLVKLLSALYRLPYQNFAGDVGFYVYQQVYPFYALAVALGGAGFPIVISKYMAAAGEQENDKKSVQRHALLALIILCAFFFVMLTLFAAPLSQLAGDRHLENLIRMAALIYLLVPFISLLRGTFQGEKENMLPTALSQIGEQVTRVCLILGVSLYLFFNHGTAYQFGLAATSGSVFAPLITVAILTFCLPEKKAFFHGLISSKKVAVNWSFIKSILVAGCLFSLLSVPLLAFQFIDSMTMLRLLGKMHLDDPRAMKGIYDRAYILTQFGMIASTSLTAAIVPRLAHLAALHRHHDFCMESTLAIKISVAFGAAAAAGLMAISREVNIMLFRNDAGTGAFTIAALTMLTLSVLLTSSGILEADGKPWLPVCFLVIGAIVKAALNILLVPQWSIAGAAASTCAGTACAVWLCLIYMYRRHLIKRLSSQVIVKIGIAVIGMLASVYVCKLFISRFIVSMPLRPAAALTAVCCTFAGGAVFLVLLYGVRFLDRHDAKRLPLSGLLMHHATRGADDEKDTERFWKL
ncbi:polysaccharide biosynthesis protein [Sporolactobacillus sp. CPB3-1]|uniref:Polysaccharide biosynthesis protein n=1 Tax=Sporolactobacillus mangiferae TaxID=2940498 RepID=A0ABT0MC72_9BACL|nr:polysaccharide biosynthesis protein [Sporolactobacillus mangiferae]MCL1632469.1 polysaccharide biosynthesis protein [Sporolactobacillus mangiferae]